jgi:thioredoxin 1
METNVTLPVVVSDRDFAATVLEAQQPVLVDFSAEWCGPCKAIAPVMRTLAAEYGERLRVATVDIDANPQLAARYRVRSVPTVMLLAKGEVERVFVGAQPAEEYRVGIDALLSRAVA